MLKTYDKIAEHTESNLYNPLTTEIPKDLKKISSIVHRRVKIYRNIFRGKWYD